MATLQEVVDIGRKDRFLAVAATLRANGTMQSSVVNAGVLGHPLDGRDVVVPESMTYKGIMLGGVPNFAFTFGYTNASWTLRADLVCQYVCRLLEHMYANGYREAVAQPDEALITTEPFIDLTSGYVMRAVDRLCHTSRLDVKVTKRADVGLDYYLPEAWAEVVERQRRDRQNHPSSLWDVVRSLRDRVAA